MGVERQSPTRSHAHALCDSGGLEPDPALVAEGWERRFIADAQRAREAMELYAELGYEVRAEPVRAADLGDDCEGCSIALTLEFKTIYTRKKGQ